MSELKVIHAYTLDEIEVICNRSNGDDCYLKSEADKVIEEQEQRYIELQDTAIELDKKLTETRKQLRHNKYKLCLKMAKICENRLGTIVKPGWWDKWYKRWLKIAEHFKDKEANNEL